MAPLSWSADAIQLLRPVALLVWMTRLWPSLMGAAQVVEPETILRWHRAGWKAFWRWKSRKRAGRRRSIVACVISFDG
jgi:hypothetical protein